ncbi:MAG TPA: BCAM0308 family protein [Pyrinomonadaceae bacterium]|nr:BCAM0308 family protein [Pyrinomonadaceae bacterium]
MRSDKPFTSATFTKRVDHEAGRHHTSRALPEPGVCKSCGAIYTNRRWTVAESASTLVKRPHARTFRMTLCPACKQSLAGEPRGFLFIEGAFFKEHREEIERLLRRESERAAEVNPLGRVIRWKRDKSDKLTVSTTTEHLAQRLGHALQKAFDGKVKYDFSHENKLARVSWRRD